MKSNFSEPGGTSLGKNEAIQSDKRILRFELAAPEVYVALEQLKRTGWVMRGVENPETVKEHTEALIKLAQEMWPDLNPAEKDGLLDMLEIHDWPEAIHGNEIILELDPAKRKALKDKKTQSEIKALKSICSGLANGDEIMRLWHRFETSDDPAAVFARQLDKYQAVEQALIYEGSQGLELFNEFVVYSLNFINHPVLLARIEALRRRWSVLQS